MSGWIEAARNAAGQFAHDMGNLALCAAFFAVLALLVKGRAAIADARSSVGEARINLVLTVLGQLTGPLVTLVVLALIEILKTRGLNLAPPHLWVMQETISEVITFLTERKRLFYYYIWDVDRGYRHGVDGLNFGPGEKQLPSPEGTLDHRFLLSQLHRAGYQGAASLKCHGTHGWSLEKIGRELRASDLYVRDAYNALAK